MNISAGLLVVIGAIIVVIGFTGSQIPVCQVIFGGKCSWLPGKENLSPEQTKPGQNSPTPVTTPLFSGQTTNV